MPEDAKLPFEYDQTGDIATVDGEDFYHQHIEQLALLAAEQIKGGSLGQAEIIEARDTIGELLVQSPYIEQPVTVEITDSDSEKFTADITTSNYNTQVTT